MAKFTIHSYKYIIFLSAVALLSSCSAKTHLEMGWYYYNQGDLCAGARLFGKAALKGDAESIYMFAHIKEHGECVEKNIKDAFTLYADSASKGYLKAQKKMGAIYYQGDWVKKDYEQSLSWYEKAATQGDAYSQYIVGFMYAYGQGVKKNSNTATLLFAKSIRAGSQEGMDELLKLQKSGDTFSHQKLCTLYKEKVISTSNYLDQQCNGQ